MAENQTSLQRATNLPPDRVPLATTYDATISASTALALNASTKIIEVSAITDGIFLLYGVGTVSSSNFSEFIQAGSTRHYRVPNGITTINFIDTGSSGEIIVIEK